MKATLLLLMAVCVARAQTMSPHAGYIYPAGAQQGTTIQAQVGGQYLNGASKAWLSSDGVEARVVRYYKPPNGADAQRLRDQARELGTKGRANLSETEKARLLEIRDRLEDWQRLPSIPAIAELVTLELTVAANAKPGIRHLRLDTNAGLTNPIQFMVGDVQEYTRKVSRVAMVYNVVNGATPATRFSTEAAKPVTEIELPAVCNGQMMPAATDRYRFHASKGERLRIAVNARELIPYLSDAVPGWFQAAVVLRDASGKELASADHNDFRPDPLVRYVIPADGDYTAEIHDSIYRGREDFVYRLSIGPDPLVRVSNLAKRPTKLKLPASITSSLTEVGKTHRFRIDGKAGDELVAEVTARRLGSPLDSTLRVVDAKGRELASNDDFEDKGAGLLTHHADSFLTIRLPAKGTYYVELADAQGHAGPEYTYRLRVSRPQPDFALRVVPASVNVRPGATVPVTVYALRRDGFNGEIALTVKNAPGKFVLSGAKIPGGEDKIRLTMGAPAAPNAEPFALELVGEAKIGGKEVVHTAVPAVEMEQAFASRHLVAQDACLVRLVGNGTGQGPWKAFENTLKLASGNETTFTLPVQQRVQSGMRVALNDPPDGITIVSCSPVPGGMRVVVSAKGKPGQKGNLILDWYRNKQRMAVLPAIPFEVE